MGLGDVCLVRLGQPPTIAVQVHAVRVTQTFDIFFWDDGISEIVVHGGTKEARRGATKTRVVNHNAVDGGVGVGSVQRFFQL